MNILMATMFIISSQIINSSRIACKRQQTDIELKKIHDIFKSIFRRYAHSDERRSSKIHETKTKFLREALSDIDAAKFKKWLRQEAIKGIEEVTEPEIEDEFEGLVENELLNALSKKSSALLDRPYVQKKGRNDFLVIRPDLKDPFVTIVPNDIYYNSEKKCVNWLDDCNQKGLRERLLQKVNSPYKK